MIKELDIKDIELINQMEESFPSVFNIGSIHNEIKTNPFSKYLIYIIDEKVVGFINYYLIYERLEIANFNVLESHQNQGIGSKLMKELINKFEQDKTNITLEVRCDNCNAIHLYKKQGFIEKATRKNYYNNADGILMEKELIKVKDIYVLGIESSCDETSFSIVKMAVRKLLL